MRLFVFCLKAHVKSVHEGIQIRRKKPSTAKIRKKTQNVDDFPEEETVVEIQIDQVDEENLRSLQTVIVTPNSNNNNSQPMENITVITDNQGTESSLSSTIKTASKKKTRTKKNPPPPPSSQIETVELSTILNLEDAETTTEIQVPPPGTIVTLEVDPTMGNVISADALGLGAVQIEEIQTVVEGEEGEDGQMTTIVQLEPGQGEYQTTYYQYTYYHHPDPE
jgi:hypothetical protein